jgi:phenylalanine-4-hydroxylase
VPGLVPDEVFFDHLANRRFPAGQFIRKPQELDYLQEPDIFHDVFGHVPMLAQHDVADFMQAMGAEGLSALRAGALHRLARLYWYSVEFGLAKEDGETRIYGAGLLSSFGESHFSLESDKPKRRAFDIPEVLRTRYRSDAFQRGYFVIESFDAMLKLLTDADLASLYEELEAAGDLDIFREG